MSRQLITTWGDYTAAADRLLAHPEPRELLIHDQDLQMLRLESSERIAALSQRLAEGCTLRIALRDGSPFQGRQPRLNALFETWRHRVQIRTLPETFAHLRDSLLIAGHELALIRFDKDQPRAVVLDSQEPDLGQYRSRFEEIWQICHDDLLHRPLGL
ncbi:MAG: hypothetical protein LWW83_03390 [Azonexaceae bacterium]|nr:hypothetical protein [Azonexaceae bacterium]